MKKFKSRNKLLNRISHNGDHFSIRKSVLDLRRISNMIGQNIRIYFLFERRLKHVAIEKRPPKNMASIFFWDSNNQIVSYAMLTSGYIGVGDGRWRQNVLVTTIRCWWRFWPFSSPTNTFFLQYRRARTFQRCHQHPQIVTDIHYLFTVPSGTNISKMSPTSTNCHQHHDITNITVTLTTPKYFRVLIVVVVLRFQHFLSRNDRKYFELLTNQFCEFSEKLFLIFLVSTQPQKNFGSYKLNFYTIQIAKLWLWLQTLNLVQKWP